MVQIILEIDDEKKAESLVAILKELSFVAIIDSEPSYFYSPENLQAIERSLRQIEEGKTVMKTLDELRAMEEE
ncbi:MAG: hypothetical protein FWG30_10890 [Eubacteriaceae bacterium]|nr:hypothetical protein [Eubacteriaceae bacterium]